MARHKPVLKDYMNHGHFLFPRVVQILTLSHYRKNIQILGEKQERQGYTPELPFLRTKKNSEKNRKELKRSKVINIVLFETY